MKLKTLLITVVVLAALSVAVYVARRPAPAPAVDVRLGQPLLDAAVLPQAARVRINDQGKSVVLIKQTDGSWRTPTYHDLPADFTKLSGLVNSLTDGKLDRLVTTNPDRIARLDFKDTKIELLDAAEKVLWAVTLGKTAEGGGRFVRFGDEPRAYLANVNVWLDAEPKNWASTELLNLKANDVAKVELGFVGVGDVVVASRAKPEDPWKAENAPSGQQLKADKISSVLSSLGTLRFSETSDQNDPNAAAAKASQRTVKLTTFDGKTFTVTLGRKPEEKKLKPPTPTTDGKTGPASLGSVADLTKKEGAETKPEEKPALAPEFETIPAGPVFVSVASSDPSARVNELMQKRAFQISEWTFTGLPQKPEELFEPIAPTPPAANANATTPASNPDQAGPAATATPPPTGAQPKE